MFPIRKKFYLKEKRRRDVLKDSERNKCFPPPVFTKTLFLIIHVSNHYVPK